MQDGTLSAAPRYSAIVEPGRFPEAWSTGHLSAVTRWLLDWAADDDARWKEALEAPEALSPERSKLEKITPENFYQYVGVCASFMLEDADFWREHDALAPTLAARGELLKLLCMSTRANKQRRVLATEHILDELDFWGGWDKLVAEGSAYQLGEARPWYKPGDFWMVWAELQELAHDDAREAEGFTRIDRNVYIDQIKRPVSYELLHQGISLSRAARAICLFTLSRSERSFVFGACEAVQKSLLYRASSLVKQHTTSIPMRSLYSLPKELRNLASFTSKMGLSIQVGEKTSVTNPETSGRAILVEGEEESGQRLLFFDPKLVSRRSTREGRLADQYIELDAEFLRSHNRPSVLDTILEAIELLPIDARLLEHVPRVTAALFSAAQRDRKLDFAHSGTFWDTDVGTRLARLSGFNPDNHRHRAIVQDVRSLLEQIILHREIKTEEGYASWSGPLIQSMKDRVELRPDQREGLSLHYTFKAWSIAKVLWDMVTPKESGGTPSYMSLDERAFRLDDRSSIPFNIYWTLINRAYMDRLAADGSLTISIKVIYEWSGLEGRFGRPHALSKKLRECFDLMVEHGLLRTWRCDAIMPDSSGLLFEDLLEETIVITFGQAQLESLEHLLPEGQLE